MARVQMILPISSNGDSGVSEGVVSGQDDLVEPVQVPNPDEPSRDVAMVWPAHRADVLATGTDVAADDEPEVFSGRRTAVSPWFGRVTVLAVVAVALAAAVASVEHLANLARVAGESGWRAWLLPAAVDGLVVASTMTLFRARQLGEAVGWVPWFSLIVGLAGSVIGNVVSVHPSLVDPGVLKIAVGATPPIALALSLHEGLEQVRGGARR